MNAPARVVNLDDAKEVSVNMEQLGVSAAEVNQQIATAKKYPRSLQKFRQELLTQATLTEEIAASCYYTVPRGGKDIEGPSTRLAEMVLSCWGNCRATARIVAETDNFIVAQGIFIDLERNVAVGVEVNRRIVDARGNRFNLDMIGVTAAAAMSIALRNAVFKGIPRVFIDEAYEAAKATVAGKLATLSDKRNRMLEAFKAYGVTEQQILAKVEKEGMADIGERELVTLRGYLTAIKQEEQDPSAIFAPAQSKAAAAQQQRQAAPAPKAESKPAVADKANTESTSPGGGESAGADAPKADGGDGGDGQAPPADTSSNSAQPSQLEDSIASALLDCNTPQDVASVEMMFASDIAAAGADEQASIERQFADVREAMAARDDDFPEDRA